MSGKTFHPVLVFLPSFSPVYTRSIEATGSKSVDGCERGGNERERKREDKRVERERERDVTK